MASNKNMLFGSLVFGLLGTFSDLMYSISAEVKNETGHDDLYDQMSLVYEPVISPIQSAWYDLLPEGALNNNSRGFAMALILWFVFALVVSFSVRFAWRNLRSQRTSNFENPALKFSGQSAVAMHERLPTQTLARSDKWIYLGCLVIGLIVSFIGMMDDIAFGNIVRSGVYPNIDPSVLEDYTMPVFWIKRFLDVIPAALITLIIAFSIRFVWRKLRKRTTS